MLDKDEHSSLFSFNFNSKDNCLIANDNCTLTTDNALGQKTKPSLTFSFLDKTLTIIAIKMKSMIITVLSCSDNFV